MIIEWLKRLFRSIGTFLAEFANSKGKWTQKELESLRAEMEFAGAVNKIIDNWHTYFQKGGFFLVPLDSARYQAYIDTVESSVEEKSHMTKTKRAELFFQFIENVFGTESREKIQTAYKKSGSEVYILPIEIVNGRCNIDPLIRTAFFQGITITPDNLRGMRTFYDLDLQKYEISRHYKFQ